MRLMMLVFVPSLVILAYSSFGKCNNYFATAYAFISCCIVSIYALFYLIRLNNDDAYYIREICNCILLLHKRKNKEKLQKYIHYFLPDIRVSHNIIERDLGVILFFILNVDFSSNKEFDLKVTGTHDEKGADDEVGNFCQNYGVHASLDDVYNFFHDLIIPLTVQMRCTYKNNSYQFILEYINQLEHIKVDLINYDLILKCFLIIVAREYLIETSLKTKKHNDEEKITKKIENWLELAEQEYGCIYETFEHSDFINYKHLKSKKESFESWVEVVACLYYSYTNKLDKASLINLQSYGLLEANYMNHHKVLVHKDNYTFFDMMFMNTYIDNQY